MSSAGCLQTLDCEGHRCGGAICRAFGPASCTNSLENSPLRRFPSIVNFSVTSQDAFEKYQAQRFEVESNSNDCQLKSGNTTNEADSMVLEESSFSRLPSPKSERVYNY